MSVVRSACRSQDTFVGVIWLTTSRASRTAIVRTGMIISRESCLLGLMGERD